MTRPPGHLRLTERERALARLRYLEHLVRERPMQVPPAPLQPLHVMALRPERNTQHDGERNTKENT